MDNRTNSYTELIELLKVNRVNFIKNTFSLVLKILLAIFLLICLFIGPCYMFFKVIKSTLISYSLSSIWGFIALYLTITVGKSENKFMLYINSIESFKEYYYEYTKSQYFIKVEIRKIKSGEEDISSQERIIRSIKK